MTKRHVKKPVNETFNILNKIAITLTITLVMVINISTIIFHHGILNLMEGLNGEQRAYYELWVALERNTSLSIKAGERYFRKS